MLNHSCGVLLLFFSFQPHKYAAHFFVKHELCCNCLILNIQQSLLKTFLPFFVFPDTIFLLFLPPRHSAYCWQQLVVESLGEQGEQTNSDFKMNISISCQNCNKEMEYQNGIAIKIFISQNNLETKSFIYVFICQLYQINNMHMEKTRRENFLIFCSKETDETKRKTSLCKNVFETPSAF